MSFVAQVQGSLEIYCFSPPGDIRRTRIFWGKTVTKPELWPPIKDGFCVGSCKNGGPESRNQELVAASGAEQPWDLRGFLCLLPFPGVTVYLLGTPFVFTILFRKLCNMRELKLTS